MIASPRVCEMLRSSTASQRRIGVREREGQLAIVDDLDLEPRWTSASRSNFSSTRMREQSMPMRIGSLTPVDLFGRSKHEPCRIEPDDLELRVAFGAGDDLAALDAVVDRDLRVALRTHDVAPRARTTRHCA